MSGPRRAMEAVPTVAAALRAVLRGRSRCERDATRVAQK